MQSNSLGFQNPLSFNEMD